MKKIKLFVFLVIVLTIMSFSVLSYSKDIPQMLKIRGSINTNFDCESSCKIKYNLNDNGYQTHISNLTNQKLEQEFNKGIMLGPFTKSEMGNLENAILKIAVYKQNNKKIEINNLKLINYNIDSSKQLMAEGIEAENTPYIGQFLYKNSQGNYSWITPETNNTQELVGGEGININNSNIISVEDSVITSTKIKDSEITSSKIQDNSISQDNLNIVGSYSNGDFLSTTINGDFTWKKPIGNLESFNYKEFFCKKLMVPVYDSYQGGFEFREQAELDLSNCSVSIESDSVKITYFSPNFDVSGFSKKFLKPNEYDNTSKKICSLVKASFDSKTINSSQEFDVLKTENKEVNSFSFSFDLGPVFTYPFSYQTDDYQTGVKLENVVCKLDGFNS